MKNICIESPFAGDVEENIKYARACMKDSLEREEAPFALHLLYTQEGILNDSIEEERNLGLRCALTWRNKADLVAFYIDRGMSSGMKKALDNCNSQNLSIDIRTLKKED